MGKKNGHPKSFLAWAVIGSRSGPGCDLVLAESRSQARVAARGWRKMGDKTAIAARVRVTRIGKA